MAVTAAGNTKRALWHFASGALVFAFSALVGACAIAGANPNAVSEAGATRLALAQGASAYSAPAYSMPTHSMPTHSMVERGADEPLERVVRRRTKSPPPAGLSVVASGFFVAWDGTFLTNAHVVIGCRTISVEHPGFGSVGATLIGVDTRLDTAILRADVPAPAVLHIEAGEDRSNAVVASFPGARAGSDGAVWRTAKVIDAGSGRPGGRVAAIDAKLRAGDSGGAVIDDQGYTVAMIIGNLDTNESRGLAVPGAALRRLLGYYDVPLPNDSSHGGVKFGANRVVTREKLDALANAVVRIKCV